MKSKIVSTAQIIVPDYAERPANKVADSRDLESIKASGIQQPLIVIEDDGRLLLVKGLRRLRIAKSLGLGKVPIVVAPIPNGYDSETYGRELRLSLQSHRQDLLPSQKCGLVEELKTRFAMSNEQVAAYLGIAADSVTNWLAVRRYIKPVVTAMDAGVLTMRAARAFDGLSEVGQRKVWLAHSGDLLGSTSTDIHKIIRTAYPPTMFPAFYRNPEVSSERLNRKQRKRRGVTRETITAAEKRRLLSSVDMKEAELRDGREKLQRMEKEINASIAPIGAILRNEKLVAMVPTEMKEELDRFAEVYV